MGITWSEWEKRNSKTKIKWSIWNVLVSSNLVIYKSRITFQLRWKETTAMKIPSLHNRRFLEHFTAGWNKETVKLIVAYNSFWCLRLYVFYGLKKFLSKFVYGRDKSCTQNWVVRFHSTILYHPVLSLSPRIPFFLNLRNLD